MDKLNQKLTKFGFGLNQKLTKFGFGMNQKLTKFGFRLNQKLTKFGFRLNLNYISCQAQKGYKQLKIEIRKIPVKGQEIQLDRFLERLKFLISCLFEQ